MQDRYVGDVGDFGKYGLLNEVCEKSKEKIKLGINWFYVTKVEKTKGDGEYTDYLSDEYRNSEKYRACFPELYDKLKIIVDDGNRSIKEIEKNLLLPKETVFYSTPLPYFSVDPSKRKEDRENWFKESLMKLKDADIIFLDPDNGIQTTKVKKTQIKAIKYIFKDEIKRYLEHDKSLIIYNHRDRKPKLEYDKKIIDAINHINAWNSIRVLRFKRFSVRDFIFIIQKDHQDLIDQAITHLIKGPYTFLFKMYDLNRVK